MFLEERKPGRIPLRRRPPDPNIGDHLPPPPAERMHHSHDEPSIQPPVPEISPQREGSRTGVDSSRKPSALGSALPASSLPLWNVNGTSLSFPDEMVKMRLNNAGIAQDYQGLVFRQPSVPITVAPIPVEEIFRNSPRREGSQQPTVHRSTDFSAFESIVGSPRPFIPVRASVGAIPSAPYMMGPPKGVPTSDSEEVDEVVLLRQQLSQCQAVAQSQLDALDLWFACGDATSLKRSGYSPPPPAIGYKSEAISHLPPLRASTDCLDYVQTFVKPK